MDDISKVPPYFRYWGKARKPVEVDYCLSNGSDEEIAQRYRISLEELKRRAARYKWKKVKPGDSYPIYHLLPFHCLDVAAVADEWWKQSKRIQHSFISTSKISEDKIKGWLLFFISLHDIGKFDIRFQRKAPKVWGTLNPDIHQNYLEGLSQHECIKYDHGPAGLYWFVEDKKSKNETITDNNIVGLFDDEENINGKVVPWIAAVAGHHGFVFPEDNLPDRSLSCLISNNISEQDRVARELWASELEKLFLHPVGLSLNDTPPKPSPLLAGFCSVSDWLGSRSDEENFCFNSEIMDLSKYFEYKRADAQRVLSLSGMQGQKIAYLSVKALLKEEYQPRQLQTLVDNLPDKAGLTIVEAPTGSGKTEAALAYAWRLLDNDLADNIIFAMPTQASANAMLQRIEQLAGKLFSDHPNIILAHGNARFNVDFSALKNAGQTVQKKEEAWAQWQ